MAYNTYGGQFQGLSAQRKTATPEKQQSIKPSTSPTKETKPAEKVVVTLGQLKQVGMDELGPDDKRSFITFALFEGEDLNEVVKHTRNRTQPVDASSMPSGFFCSFAGETIVLPLPAAAAAAADGDSAAAAAAGPPKRLLLYVAAITTKTNKDEDGRVFKDIALMGIGFSEPFVVDMVKKYPHRATQLRLVEGGDPSIKPGILDVAIDCCLKDKGPPIPEDKEESVMAQFEASG